MRIVLIFSRAYPWQSLSVLLALLVSGFAEGISLFALLPLLNTALGTGGQMLDAGQAEASHGPTQIIVDTLQGWGITPSLRVLLTVV